LFHGWISSRPPMRDKYSFYPSSISLSPGVNLTRTIKWQSASVFHGHLAQDRDHFPD
jgi:hypothetical protein